MSSASREGTHAKASKRNADKAQDGLAPVTLQASALIRKQEADERAAVVPQPNPTPDAAPMAQFEAWRTQLMQVRSGGALLDALIDSKDAPRLVPMLPIEDLHGYIRRIGLLDCTELLPMVSGDQLRGMLDVEIWDADQMDIDRLDPWLRALMASGQETLGRRMLDLDDEVLNWTVRRFARALVIEDPDSYDPPDLDHILTPDGRLCIIFPEGGERDLPIKLFLDWLMRGHPVFCVDLLIHSSAALDANLQEQAYRWRSGRMADRGYVDYYEALGIYTAPNVAAPVQGEGVASHHWMVEVTDPDARLNAAIEALDAPTRERLAEHLGYTANTALSADRADLLDENAVRETMVRLRAGLVLGLDALAGSPAVPAVDAQVLATHGPTHVFRVGYARMLDAAKPLRLSKIRRLLRLDDDPVGALDSPTWRTWGEALLARHPHHPEGRPLRASELPFAAAWANALATLATVAGAGRPAEVGLGAWLGTGIARAALGDQGFAPLTTEQVSDAHRALFEDGAIRPEARIAADAWWTAQEGDATTLALLLEGLREQIGAQSPDALDPRFALWLRVEDPPE